MHGCINVDELLASLSDDDDDTLTSNEDCFGEMPESAIPSKANADEKADPLNPDEIFDGLGDIVSPCELYLGEPYLELDDLKSPLDDNAVEFGICDLTAPLNTPNIPSHVVDDPGNNVRNQAATHNLDAPAVRIMSDVANNSVLQTLLAGEQHELPLPSAHVSMEGCFI